MNQYDASHLRSLLAAANLAAGFGEHELKRARERVAVKNTELKQDAAAARTASDTNFFYGMDEKEWGLQVREARRLLDAFDRAEYQRRLAERTPEQVARDEKPYYVYTRLYKDNGDCEKRVHYFKTAAAQSRFIATTHRAVTNFN